MICCYAIPSTRWSPLADIDLGSHPPHSFIYTNNPTIATATQTATDKTVPGSSSAGAAPVYVAGATGQLEEAELPSAGDTGLLVAGETGAETRLEPTPSDTTLARVLLGAQLAQLEALLAVTTAGEDEVVTDFQTDHAGGS